MERVLHPVATAYTVSSATARVLTRPVHALFNKVTNVSSVGLKYLNGTMEPYLHVLLALDSCPSEAPATRSSPRLTKVVGQVIQDTFLLVFAPIIITHHILMRQYNTMHHYARTVTLNSVRRARSYLSSVLDPAQTERNRQMNLQLHSLREQVSVLESEVEDRSSQNRYLQTHVDELREELDAAKKAAQDLEERSEEHQRLEKHLAELQVEFKETKRASRETELAIEKLQEKINLLEEEKKLAIREHAEVGVGNVVYDEALFERKPTKPDLTTRESGRRTVSLSAHHLRTKPESGDTSNPSTAPSSPTQHHATHSLGRRTLLERVRSSLHLSKRN